MEFFEYDNLWIAYITALGVLGLSGYMIIKPIPYRWIKWNLVVAIIVFLASPIQTEEQWMIPSALYFLFEYFFVGNLNAIEVLHKLLQHVVVACIVTSLMLTSIHLMSTKPKLNSKQR